MKAENQNSVMKTHYKVDSFIQSFIFS